MTPTLTGVIVKMNEEGLSRAKEYVIYKNKETVISGVSPLEITGLTANTDISAGTYKVSYKGSQEFTDISAFRTLLAT